MINSTVSIEQAQQIFDGVSVKNIFETAKGSIYFVSEQNATLRYKSFHLEHGATDQGWKDVSKFTVYVREEDAIHIAGTLRGNGWLVLKEVGGNNVELHFVSHNRLNGSIGKTFEIISFQTVPRVGLSPIELFDVQEVLEGIHKPKGIHPGNRITRIAI